MKQTICIYAFAALLLGGCISNNELTIPTNLRMLPQNLPTAAWHDGWPVASLLYGAGNLGSQGKCNGNCGKKLV